MSTDIRFEGRPSAPFGRLMPLLRALAQSVYRACAVMVWAALTAAPALAQACPPQRIVNDLTTSPTQSAFSTSQTLFSSGGVAYFPALIPGAGYVLYRSDGTAEGTIPYTPGGPATFAIDTPVSWSAGGLVVANVSTSRASIVTPSGITAFDIGFRQATSSLPLNQHFLDIGPALIYIAQPFSQPINVYSVSFPGGVPTRQTLLPLSSTDWRVSQLVRLGNLCLFATNNAFTLDATRIYVTDGTPGGTRELIDSSVGCTSPECSLRGSIDDIYVLNGRAYFARFVNLSPTTGSWQLWSTDGTPEGTSACPGIAPEYLNGRPRILGAIGSKLVMSGFTDFAVPPGTTSGLHVYDTQSGVISFVPYLVASPISQDRSRAIDIGGRLVFAGRVSGSTPDTEGTEPWVTDGTSAGTFPLGDLNPGVAFSINVSTPTGGVAVNGRAIFGATINNGGRLWSTDGTVAGTQEIAGSAQVGSPILAGTFTMLSAGSRGYFSALSTTQGSEPWITDGTPAGTRLLADVMPGATSSSPAGFVPISGGVVFHAVAPDVGNELLFTDGVNASLVKDLAGGTVSSEARLLARDNSVAIFASSSQPGVTGVYEWGGSRSPAVQRMGSIAAPLSSQPFGLESIPGFGTYFTTPTRLYLASPALDSATQITNSPVSMVQIPNFGTSALPHALIGTRLVFPAILQTAAPGLGQEPFITDGTVNGTVMLKDISSGSASSGPSNFVSLGSRVFFYASTPQTGAEPWGTDGTTEGTLPLGDFFPGSQSSLTANPDQSPGPPVVFNGRAFAVATVSQSSARALISSDATPQGTAIVNLGNVAPLGLLSPSEVGLFFVGQNQAAGAELFITDGTPEGTRVVRDITAGSGSTTFRFVQGAGPRAFFAVVDNNPFRATLYVTDGSSDGTSVIPWPVAGQYATALYSAGVVRGKLLYVGLRSGSSNDYQLLVSDGSPAGTCIIGPWTGESVLNTDWIRPTVVNSRVFVTMSDSLLGKEPIVFNFCPADFNNSGGDPTMQDLFDFLTAFFSGDPAADINNTGGFPTVQDIFDFITVWFAGCT